MEFVKKDIVSVSQLGGTGSTTSSKPLGLGRLQNRARDSARESARQGLQVPVLIFKGQDGNEVRIENSKENKIYSINSTNQDTNGNAGQSQNAGKKKRKTRRKKTKSKKSKKNKSKKNKIKTKKRSKKLK